MKEKGRKPGPRMMVFRILEKVLEKGTPLDDALEVAFLENPDLDSRDRAFIKNLAATVFRNLAFIDRKISGFLKRPLPKRALWVRHWLRIGIAQILFFDVPGHAAVDTTVEAISTSKRSGAKAFRGLANAILRNAIRQKEEILNELARNPGDILPRWLRERWESFYGEETVREISRVLAGAPPLDISLRNPEQAKELAGALGAEEIYPGVLRFKAKGLVTDLPGFKEGKWWAQDVAAGLPARLLGAVAGKKVLDFCAAPGGKTLFLASRGAKVTAVDIAKPRLKRVAENLARTGLKAEVIQSDVLKFSASAPYNLILLDAPCSATGTLRRHPDVPYHRGKEDIKRLAGLQWNMLGHTISLLAPGGILVYCVCSLEKEEGEDLIDRFLADNPGVSRLPIDPKEVGGQAEWVTASGDLRTLPCHLRDRGGMDGFFAARLTR